LLLALLLTASLWQPLFAQPWSAPDMRVEGAKKEQKLVFYTTLDLPQNIKVINDFVQRTPTNHRVLRAFAVEFRLCAAVLMCLILQKPFRVDRRHATGAGRRDCLPIDMILHVAASKDAGNIRFSAVVGFDVAVRI